MNEEPDDLGSPTRLPEEAAMPDRLRRLDENFKETGVVDECSTDYKAKVDELMKAIGADEGHRGLILGVFRRLGVQEDFDVEKATKLFAMVKLAKADPRHGEYFEAMAERSVTKLEDVSNLSPYGKPLN